MYIFRIFKLVLTTNDLWSNINIRKTVIKSMRKVGVSPPVKVEFVWVFQIPVVAHMKFTLFTRPSIARFCKDECFEDHSLLKWYINFRSGRYMNFIRLQNTKKRIRISDSVFRKLWNKFVTQSHYSYNIHMYRIIKNTNQIVQGRKAFNNFLSRPYCFMYRNTSNNLNIKELRRYH